MAVSLSVRMAAEQCSLSERTIHAAIKRGALKVMRVGRRVLIAPEALDDYLHGTTGKSNAVAQLEIANPVLLNIGGGVVCSECGFTLLVKVEDARAGFLIHPEFHFPCSGAGKRFKFVVSAVMETEEM